MIRELRSLDGCLDFILEINSDPAFSDPMLSTPWLLENNLLHAAEKPNDHLFGVCRDGALVGLFDFLILPGEKYLEMIAGLSREAAVYEEMAAYLEREYPGFQADFVFNPANAPLKALLERKQALFCPEQQKMVLSAPPAAVDTAGIEPLSAAYLPQYLAMHGTDVYWTGEKVAAAVDRFRVLLAVDSGAVVGYLDVTHCFDENEPYDLFVREEHRRRGWGRKLLARAVELNRPNGMMLLVETDNIPAIRLYESLGFEAVPGQNSLTATWRIGAGA